MAKSKSKKKKKPGGKAAEIDGGEFVISVGNDPTPRCWIYADITNGVGTEYWRFANGFSAPASGASATWVIRKLLANEESGSLPQWRVDHPQPLARRKQKIVTNDPLP